MSVQQQDNGLYIKVYLLRSWVQNRNLLYSGHDLGERKGNWCLVVELMIVPVKAVYFLKGVTHPCNGHKKIILSTLFR